MPNRNRAWADSVFNGAQILDEGTSLTNLLLNAPTVDTLTVVRLVLDLYVSHGVDEAATDESNAISVGIGVSSVEAFNQGIDALPEPQFGIEYPPRGWLYVATKPARQMSVTTGFLQETAMFQADLRAMRKIDKGILFLAVQNNAIFGTGDVDLWGRVRALCLT